MLETRTWVSQGEDQSQGNIRKGNKGNRSREYTSFFNSSAATMHQEQSGRGCPHLQEISPRLTATKLTTNGYYKGLLLTDFLSLKGTDPSFGLEFTITKRNKQFKCPLFASLKICYMNEILLCLKKEFGYLWVNQELIFKEVREPLKSFI